MAPPNDCHQNLDPLRLVREGTPQGSRYAAALKPANVPVDGKSPAHGVVFARAYATFLKYYGLDNNENGDWTPFFGNDLSAPLATMAIEELDPYKAEVKAHFEFLGDNAQAADESGLKEYLGCLFSAVASLAGQMDQFHRLLPDEVPLKNVVRTLIRTQLMSGFGRLMAYYKADVAAAAPHPLIGPNPAIVRILGAAPVKFADIYLNGLSAEWIPTAGTPWADYRNNLAAEPAAFGTGVTVFARANHLATHNLFRAVFDQFLKAYARIVSAAEGAFAWSLQNWNRHEPHYALFLSFLRLLEYARAEANTLTGRHLDFYYREVLRLRPQGARAPHAHLLIELAKAVPPQTLDAGELFQAGKDRLGKPVFFANDRPVVLNQARVASLRTIYRHGPELVGLNPPSDREQGRLFASPVANSDDGAGAELVSVDGSWHPFHNKRYQDGRLVEIRMPKAEVGFAIASHYLWMAGGRREVLVKFTVENSFAGLPADLHADLKCDFTSEKGWMGGSVTQFSSSGEGLVLKVELSGEAPAVAPYLPATHGDAFATDLPVMKVTLRQEASSRYIHSLLETAKITAVRLTVKVEGLKAFTVSNDFGPADIAKPFQPYGPLPGQGSSWILGSKELFQKKLVSAKASWTWLAAPKPFKDEAKPNFVRQRLRAGTWGEAASPVAGDAADMDLDFDGNPDPIDLSPEEPYSALSRHGFVRMQLDAGLGHEKYQEALVTFLKRRSTGAAPAPPTVPVLELLSVQYTAEQIIPLSSANSDAFAARAARFFHVAPFGVAEQHAALNATQKVRLVPAFGVETAQEFTPSESEFYLGLAGLRPPQSLSLFIQVADGTADPLAEKPEHHIRWSYLRGHEWMELSERQVDDRTDGLLNSGILTLQVPRDATDQGTLFPAGMHWIRAAVARQSDAVCRLLLVGAQGVEVTFADRDNDPALAGDVVPAGTVNKLEQPRAGIKKVGQPFPGFGGRGAETSDAFYTRISERLRHKDRGIALWDVERLVLQAFSEIYQAKCLNHTQYEPDASGAGIYRELAPGHLTVVTIPDQQLHNVRDPLRPYTNLGLLVKIESFLRQRMSCFARLHVKNPQFEEVRIRCRVRLRDGFDEGEFLRKLQEDVTRFLSPWAFPGGGRPTFGGKISKTVLIDFLENQPCLDYLTDFDLFHTVDGVEQLVAGPEAAASKAISILVSALAAKHDIRSIPPSVEAASAETCLCQT